MKTHPQGSEKLNLKIQFPNIPAKDVLFNSDTEIMQLDEEFQLETLETFKRLRRQQNLRLDLKHLE